MCQAGFEVLDVYPISASFPNGTDNSLDPYDAVHYKDLVFKPAEHILLEYFSPRWTTVNNTNREVWSLGDERVYFYFLKKIVVVRWWNN